MRLLPLLVPVLSLLFGCPSTSAPAPTLVGVEVEPGDLSLPAGLSTTLTAWGVYDDGTRLDRSQDAEWISSSPQFAVVDDEQPGRVTALRPGTTAISAALEDWSAAATLEVTDAQVLQIVITPLEAEIPLGQGLPMTATGLLSDGGQRDVTGSVIWSADPAEVADFEPAAPSTLRALGVGLADVSASLGEVAGAAEVAVVGRELLELTLTPDGLTLPLGLQGSLTARGRWSDGAEEDVGSLAAWSSSNGEVASVAGGLVSSLDTGTTLIEARVLGLETEVLVTVTQPVEVGLRVEPETLEMLVGDTAQLSATVERSDGSEVAVVQGVFWSSTVAGVATASSDEGDWGQVLALGEGTATLWAHRGDLSASVAVTVGAPALVSLALDPPDLSLVAGDAGAFEAVGTWSDGSTADLSGSVSWSIGPLGPALVDAGGTVTALAEGFATVTASAGAFSVDGEVEVEPAALRSIAVTPVDLELPVGAQQGMVATGTWSNGAVSDVTGEVFWGSSAPGFATVTNLAPDEGLVSAVAPGGATILATSGPVSGSVVIAVVEAEPASAEVVGPDVMNPGQVADFTLLVDWTDGSQSSEAADVGWSSDDPAVLTTSNDAGQEGRVTAQTAGQATLQASFGDLEVDWIITVVD